MAKIGLNTTKARSLLTQKSSQSGWTLCVGAGVSLPAFPDWKTLVSRLISNDTKHKIDAIELSEGLLAEFSPDGAIEAVFERLSLSSSHLSEALYLDMMSKFTKEEWLPFAKILGDSSPGAWQQSSWDAFNAKITKEWPDLTSTKIARALSKVTHNNKAPKAVISFNAEPLLHAQLNYFSRKSSASNSKRFDILVRSTSNRAPDRIPYYFIHGLLGIPELPKKLNKVISNEKLVFSENAYLNLSNNNYSWQSNQFISAATNTHMVFIGLSMTDPNLRKWLGWIHSLRITELSSQNSKSATSTQHYCIRKRPQKKELQQWIESAVSHLGIRIVWIDSWSEIGETLDNMLC